MTLIYQWQGVTCERDRLGSDELCKRGKAIGERELLKQAPRVGNNQINKYLLKVGFTRCPYEHALYIKISNNGDLLLVCLYIDDLIFIGNNPKMFKILRCVW